MTLSVLADQVPQVCPEPRVCDCGLVIAPIFDGEAFEEDKTFAVEQFGAYGLQ